MNRLKELREMHGWSMKEAAKNLGIPYTTYVGYEKGERGLNSELMVQLADFYGVSVDYLICNEKKDSSLDDELVKQLQILRDREDLRALLDVTARRTPEQIKKLTELFSSMPEG